MHFLVGGSSRVHLTCHSARHFRRAKGVGGSSMRAAKWIVVIRGRVRAGYNEPSVQTNEFIE